jgi:hypothetical protein
MGKADYLKHGDYNAICDQCGFKWKASKLRVQWNNLFTCPDCFEPRNPQDFVKGIADDMRVSIARPDVNPKFITEDIDPNDLDGKPH